MTAFLSTQLIIENISVFFTRTKLLLTFVIASLVIAGFPHIQAANAFSIPFHRKLNTKPNIGIEQPMLFSPDRYTYTTEYRTVTSYNSEVGQTDSTPFKTAIGSKTRHGVVAANWLPIGTMVRFVEYDPETWYVVEDRMAPRFDDRTDIWMENKADSKKFGRRRLAIEIARPVR